MSGNIIRCNDGSVTLPVKMVDFIKFVVVVVLLFPQYFTVYIRIYCMEMSFSFSPYFLIMKMKSKPKPLEGVIRHGQGKFIPFGKV